MKYIVRFYLYEITMISKSLKTENTLVDSRGWGKRRKTMTD